MGEGAGVAKLREVEGWGREGGNNASNRHLKECL